MRPVHTLLLALACATTLFAGLAEDVESITGAHTRIAWLEGKSGNGRGSEIWVFDTKDGKAARKIFTAGFTIMFVHIAPSGKSLVYNNESANEIRAIDWDGSNERKLKTGGVTGVWKGPSGNDWVLAIPSCKNHSGQKPVKRFRLDKPSEEVTIMSSGNGVGWCYFNMSADGKYGGIEWGQWGNTGVVKIDGTSYTKYGVGCQCGIAYDNSYRFMDLATAEHKALNIWDLGRKKRGTFGAPQGISTIGNPRWVYNTKSCNAIVACAPDPHKSKGKGDIVLIKLKSDFSGIEKHVWIEKDGTHSAAPYVWVNTGGSVSANRNVNYAIRQTAQPARGMAVYNALGAPVGAAGALQRNAKGFRIYRIDQTGAADCRIELENRK
jgi:hypothetical protein